MTKLFYTALIILSVFTFSSCHSLVDDEFENYEPVPVLNGLLQADSSMRIQISLTANLSDSTLKFVDNAMVIIESNVNMPDTLSYTSDGWYVSAQRVKAGATYTCKALIEGFPVITAQTAVPEVTYFDSIVFTEFAGRGTEGEKISSVEFRIPNNNSKKQFWEVQLITEGLKPNYNFETYEWTEHFGSEIEYIYMVAAQDSVLLNEANPLTVFSNQKIKKQDYTVMFYVNESYVNLRYSDTPYILLKTIDESYYKYLKQYYIYESADEISIGKSPQRYPLYSNIVNGLGIFTGVSSIRKELKLTFRTND